MEFFLLILKHVCKVLNLSLAIGSKTVGKEVGRQENAGKLARVMENWRQVWARDQVRAKEALVLPVALDERTVPQDWVCVVVRSTTAGEKLGDAKQLLLQVYDSAKRVSASRKLASSPPLRKASSRFPQTTKKALEFTCSCRWSPRTL